MILRVEAAGQIGLPHLELRDMAGHGLKLGRDLGDLVASAPGLRLGEEAGQIGLPHLEFRDMAVHGLKLGRELGYLVAGTPGLRIIGRRTYRRRSSGNRGRRRRRGRFLGDGGSIFDRTTRAQL